MKITRERHSDKTGQLKYGSFATMGNRCAVASTSGDDCKHPIFLFVWEREGFIYFFTREIQLTLHKAAW